jgi:hypothetical protein
MRKQSRWGGILRTEASPLGFVLALVAGIVVLHILDHLLGDSFRQFVPAGIETLFFSAIAVAVGMLVYVVVTIVRSRKE